MTKKLKETTSKRIKELRLSHNLTMEVLAEKIDVSKSTIAKWENGYVENMRQDNIIKLAALFNVPPTYIMGYDMDDKISDIDFSNMTPQEEHFMRLYSRLEAYQREIVDKLLESLQDDK